MRVLFFIFPFFFLLTSCSQNKLPTIKNPQALHNDCLTLFQQYPIIVNTNPIVNRIGDYEDENQWAAFIYMKLYYPKYVNLYTNKWFRDIPANSWPQSIQGLKPIAVHRDNFGISIWIKANKHPTETVAGNWLAKGYFISCGPHLPVNPTFNVSWYNNINLPGIYEIIAPAEAQ